MKGFARASLVMCILAAALVVESRGQCMPPSLPDLSNTLVIDARPNAINKFDGRTKFKKDARISIINMNPFLYTYEVNVQQTEIKDTALFDIFQFLGSPLSDLLGIAAVDRNLRNAEKPVAPISDRGDVEELILLTDLAAAPTPGCTPPATAADAKQAIQQMIDLRRDILARKMDIETALAAFDAEYDTARPAYQREAGVLFSPETVTATLCTSANTLNNDLTTSSYPTSRELVALTRREQPRRAAGGEPRISITTFDSLVTELRTRAELFRRDKDYANCKVKHKGYDFVDNVARLANVLGDRSSEYSLFASDMMQETQKYEFMQAAIAKLGTPEGQRLLQKEFDFRGQYDVSAFDVEITPVAVQRREIPASDVAQGDPLRESSREPFRSANPVEIASVEEVSLPFTNRAAPARRASALTGRSSRSAREEDSGEGGGGGGGAAPQKTRASGTIGNRRFELSGGVVYSPLRKTEFQPVLGFARDAEGNVVDAEGNPTDERELSSIVGVSEDSKQRISPLVMLHTRLTPFRENNVFFSLGFTGKKDDAGFDLEFLVGPSFNFAFARNLFFTVGGYAGRQQRLAGDLFLNARLPEGADSVPVTKGYQWKPGFAFTYRFPLKSKTESTQ